jgi:AbrB family looped-hinge helix DNA binding protein
MARISNAIINEKVVIMRITSNGQITIPIEIRKKLGFLGGSEVDFKVVNGKVYLKRARSQTRRKKRNLIARMRGKATVKMTTNDIMALTRG